MKNTKRYGRVQDGILIKEGRKVQKFWKHDGYGVKVSDLQGVDGVQVDSEYDGKLYTSVSNLWENGINHDFEGEKQIILPVKFWRKVK